MPYSLILNLLPTSPIPPGFTSGKNLHALFLNLVSAVDPQLGEQLHQNQANKPFTISPLQQIKVPPRSPKPKPKLKSTELPARTPNAAIFSSFSWNYRQPIPAGTPCWWRISLLDDALFGQLSQLWLNLNPAQPWHLGPADLLITSVIGTPQAQQPWANFCDYTQLLEGAREARKITLEFFTPTAFRLGNYDSSLPTAERVFGSLLRKWNRYSDLPFEQKILSVIYDSQYDIVTKVATDPRQQFEHTGAKVSHSNQFTGCVGRVTYRIAGKKVDSLVVSQLNALADFAMYAGVGRKTPMGMGVVKRVMSDE